MRNTTLLFSTIASALVISLMAVTPAHATLIPVVVGASNNATVQPAGTTSRYGWKEPSSIWKVRPRCATTPNASSFGVIDFSFAGITLPATPSNIAGATLNLTESNAAFSAAGPVSVYLASTAANAVSIESTNTNLNYSRHQ